MFTVRRIESQPTVEDPNRDVISVSLYNFLGLFLADLEVLKAHFPIGMVTAIREPWVNISAASSHPSAFVRSTPLLTSINPGPIAPLAWKVDIDVAKIEDAILYNLLRPNGISITPEGKARSKEDEKDPPYALPSLFNHSCHPNSVWISVALETLWSFLTTTERHGYQHLTPIIGPCDCVMCVSERADGENACGRSLLRT